MRRKIKKAIYIHPKELTGRKGDLVQFCRFGVSGGVSAALEIVTLMSLVHITHIYYLYSNIAAFTLANLLNYYLSRKWVYGKSKYLVGFELFAFFVTAIIGLLINQLVLKIMVDSYHLYLFTAKIIAIIITIIWNFFSKRLIVFKS